MSYIEVNINLSKKNEPTAGQVCDPVLFYRNSANLKKLYVLYGNLLIEYKKKLFWFSFSSNKAMFSNVLHLSPYNQGSSWTLTEGRSDFSLQEN